jgi:hypothetical protein
VRTDSDSGGDDDDTALVILRLCKKCNKPFQAEYQRRSNHNNSVYACPSCGHRSKYFVLLPQVSDLELEATACANVTARLAPPGKATKLREYFTMDYCNRWLALILPNVIPRHPSIATKLPTDLDEQKQPMPSYR